MSFHGRLTEILFVDSDTDFDRMYSDGRVSCLRCRDDRKCWQVYGIVNFVVLYLGHGGAGCVGLAVLHGA